MRKACSDDEWRKRKGLNEKRMAVEVEEEERKISSRRKEEALLKEPRW